ncbi:GNAT family N-acetyltransferase [Dysgonomonas sp. 216]|nr:GNAT family N-acetyltransferase [Dysgonomonas sp. 216]
MNIRLLTEKEPMPFDLLYLADPSPEAVADYLDRGECFAAFNKDGEVVGEYVLLPTRPFTIELVNIAVAESLQSMGLGKALIFNAIEAARAKNYKTLEVGTGNTGIDQLAFYQKCGFTITSVDFDFFTKHYPEPIFENGVQCRHMIRLRMDL